MMARMYGSMNFSGKCAATLLIGWLGLFGAVAPMLAGNHVIAWGAGTFITQNPNDVNNFGQSIVPPNLTNAVEVAGGWRHSVALTTAGTLVGWGADLELELDFPTGTNYCTNYSAIACGYIHTLLLATNGSVQAVGDDAHGQTDVPTNLNSTVAIACGFYHNLVLQANGTVVAWGAGANIFDGSDGAGFGQSVVPPGLSNVVAIAAGGYHNLVLKADGS
jgi:alpha-tubulin suppressor-like RCC1 family protein